jgi:hypothetical protein
MALRQTRKGRAVTLSDSCFSETEVRRALWEVLAGRDLRYGDPLRGELLDRGLAQEQPTGALIVTTPGLALCETEPRSQ